MPLYIAPNGFSNAIYRGSIAKDLCKYPVLLIHSSILIATLGGEGIKKGVYALRTESPLGPFALYSRRLPDNWACIEGTVFFEDGIPWLVFSHSFEDSPDGDICAVPLRTDFYAAGGEPVKLFSAPAAPWAKPVPFAKAEFGMEWDVYFTDDPFLAQKFSERINPEDLYRILDAFAKRYCPIIDELKLANTWSIQQIECSADIVFRKREVLQPVYSKIIKTAVFSVNPDNIATFPGKRITYNCVKEVGTNYNQRILGTRIKHHMGDVSIKMYD